MNINLHNYESYLLQYIDNELSAVEAAAVEAFAKQYPHIQKELDNFLAVKLTDAANIINIDKSTLLKQENTFVTEANFEALCCQYVDGALTPVEKAAVETYATNSNELTAMLTQFMATKLPLEAITFPNKDLLLKKERNSKVIPLFAWQKMAAAAAVVGIIFSVSYNVFYNQKQVPTVEIVSNTATAQLPKANTEIIVPNTAEKNTNVGVVTVAATNKKQWKNAAIVIEKNKAATDIVENSTKENYATNTIINTNNNNNEKAETLANNGINSQNALSKFADIIAEENNFEKNSNLTATASYNIIDTDDEVDNSMYIGAIQLNKNKMKGLLKKAKSLFGVKKNKQPDEDANGLLQVANFEINTSKTLK